MGVGLFLDSRLRRLRRDDSFEEDAEEMADRAFWFFANGMSD